MSDFAYANCGCNSQYGHVSPCPYATPIKITQTSLPPTPMTAPVGWLCPACGGGNAPTTATCPCRYGPDYLRHTPARRET